MTNMGPISCKKRRFQFGLRALLMVPVVVAVLLALFIAADRADMIMWYYPRLVENPGLTAPIEVVKVDGNSLTLEDGRVIVLTPDADAMPIESSLSDSRNLVDVETSSNDPSQLMIYFNSRIDWICGTPWQRPITVAVIPWDIKRNRRMLLGSGHVAEQVETVDNIVHVAH